jgi:hypothetical protein
LEIDGKMVSFHATAMFISSPFLKMIILVVVAGLASTLQGLAVTAADYRSTKIQGWTVWLEKSLDTHPRKEQALKLISTKLAQVKKVIPDTALPALKKVPIWLSRNAAPGAAYHPSADWLAANGRVVEMERSIELANIDDFIDWSVAQPMMLLHELSHAWHHQIVSLSYDNPRIKKAYDAAVAAGIYESVDYYNGQKLRAYALNNPMEYFAECSEAYFGKNDFEPFNRAELKTFDPEGWSMVRKMWAISVTP